MTLPIEPQDEYNRLLESRVHPRDWLMPTARSRYHLVVIGAGPAGLVAAAGAAGLGARVAIVERAWMGGDCLNVGCVPSKALLSSARVAALVRDSERHGIANTSEYAVNFGAIMTRMRRLRSSLSVHDSAARFRDLGIDVFLGQGRFIDSDTVDVEGQKLHFRRAVIATGARAAAPPIPGIEDAGYLTNETIFSLTELPQRLVVIGGGPIGCEMAQAFARFGSEVTQIEQGPHVLPREEREAASLVQHALVRDGVRVLTNAQVTQLRREHNTRSVTVETQGTSEVILADQILVAAGRIANTDHMGLEQAGVQYDSRRGIEVDDFLRTTNSRIFAAGDVCSRYQFTHAADAMARIVIQNALFRGRKRISSLQIPWCTYTSPELAHIGLSPAEALMRGLAIDTFTQPLAGLDRAVVAEETDGFVRVYVRKGTDQIVGATIVAGNAGDLMGEVALAITHKMGLRKLATTIHPYPTHAEAFRKLGDQYNRTRLTPWIQRLLKGWMNLNIGAAE